jgi:hypothetical protein
MFAGFSSLAFISDQDTHGECYNQLYWQANPNTNSDNIADTHYHPDADISGAA